MKHILVKLIGSSLVKLLEVINLFHPVRFSFLDGLRIGQLTIFPETYLREKRAGGHKEVEKITHIFFSESACNRTLMNLVKRQMTVIESNWVYRSIMRLKNIRNHPLFYEIDISKKGQHYHANFLKVEKMEHELRFTNEEERVGQEFLSKIGIENDDKFICFHNRDAAYLSAKSGVSEFSYHNYRDSSIVNYIPAIEWLSSEGFYCFRMGESTSEPLPVGLSSRVIDYAEEYRSDFLDIYLLSKAEFVIGTSCGLMQVPSIFNTPVAFVNMISVDVHGYSERDLFIPKKMVWEQDNCPLNYSKILSLGAESWSRGELFKEANIKVIENSSSEILELTKEMVKHVNGKLSYYESYHKEYEQFKNHFDSRHFCSQVKVLVSPSFLKSHPELYQ